jgi:hypothetical protein
MLTVAKRSVPLPGKSKSRDAVDRSSVLTAPAISKGWQEQRMLKNARLYCADVSTIRPSDV